MLLVCASLAGCTGAQTGNPNLAAPKLVLEMRPDGDVALFVHSAFDERLYDWIAVEVDNVTLVNRTAAFSVEETLPNGSFFVRASAQAGSDLYEIRLAVEMDPAEERALVSFLSMEGDWSNPQSFSLPFQRVLNRRADG